MKFLFVILNFLICNAMAQQIIPLYNGAVPNSKTDASVVEKSAVDANGILRISEVTLPTLSVYLPEPGKANGTAVIICPGGGYWILAAGHEGEDVAKEFAKISVTAFVLKYRLPDVRIQFHPEIAPLQDAQRAIQLVRERAEEWKIEKTKIGIMGFSAGGHLASTAGTKFLKPQIENGTPENIRPDFMILIYPVISADATISHGGSFEKLVGKESSADKRNEFSSEKNVTRNFRTTASNKNG